MIASVGLKRHSSLLCRRINSIHQGRGYQHVLLCPTTAEICTNECCAYTCVLNHQMPFPARISISSFQPSLREARGCKMRVTLAETPCSKMFTARGLCWRKQPQCRTQPRCCLPCTLLQMSGNLKHWHPTWIATPSQLLTPQNRGEAPSLHGLEGSQQQCFKLNALDDLHCSPALAWQLYFWLNCIFWFANVGSGNISGKTWPQLRMRSFAAHFPWGQHFAHFFKVNTRQNTKYSIPLCISQKKVFKYWRLSKRRKTLFSCAFTNGLNLKNN